MKLEDLFLDYLRAGGSWLESSWVVSTTTSKSKELQAEEVYVKYMDLKKRHGAVTAKMIRDEKRSLQDELDKRPKVPGEEPPLPFVFAHPDLPGSEDRAAVMIIRTQSLPPDFHNPSLTGLGDDQGV